MPGGNSGRLWLAALVGIDGSLTGLYICTKAVSQPGGGSALFLAFLIAFVLLTVYRNAFRSLDAAAGSAYTF
jgi:hypothetical protein